MPRLTRASSPLPGPRRTYQVDTLLIAVGLSPCDELLAKSKDLKLKVYAAGDTAEIAEASAAIFSGRIVGRQIANDLGVPVAIPQEWPGMAAILRSRPGPTVPFEVADRAVPVFPVIRWRAGDSLQPVRGGLSGEADHAWAGRS